MLDQDPDEALQRAEQRAVDHVRRVLGVVGADIGEAERFGICASSWIVPICQERPRTSVMCRSIFGP